MSVCVCGYRTVRSAMVCWNLFVACNCHILPGWILFRDSRSPVGRVGPTCIHIVFESIDQRGQQYCRRTFQQYKVHDIGAEVDYRSLPEINIIMEVPGPCHVRDWCTRKATEVTEAY